MAYTADINIVVKGQQAVNNLQKSLNELAQKVDFINKRNVGPSTSLNTFNAQLERASALLSRVAAGTSQESAAINTYVTALGQANAARQRQNTLIQQEITLRERAARMAALPAPIANATQYTKPIGPKGLPGTALAGAFTGMGMPTFAAAASFGGKASGGIGGVLSGAIPGAIISGAFPLLTGQGMEAAAGGGIGGLLGGVLGSRFGAGGAQMGSFAGGLVGSIIGELRGEAKKLTAELERQVKLNQGIELAETRILNLKKSSLVAQQQGNQTLSIEVERRQKNAEIAAKLLEASTALLSDERNKTKEGAALVALEEKRLYGVAQRAIQENNATAALEKQKALYDEQIQAIQFKLQLAQAQVARENQIITKSAELVQARTQAEVAANNATKQRLETELKGNISQERRVQIAKDIYNLEVANAKAQRIASLAQIDANIQLAAQAVKEQALKLQSLEVEKQLLIAKNMETAAIDRAIQLQKEGIAMAEDNYKFSVAIGKEQAKAAEQVYKSAVDAAEQNYKSNSAAQQLASNTAAAANEAGRYAQNTKKALSYTEKLMQQIGSVKYRDRKGPGVTGRVAAPSDPYLQRVLQASPGNADVIRQVVLAQQQRSYADALKQYEEDLMAYKSYRAAGISAPVPARPKPPSGNFEQSYSLYAEGGFVTRPTNAIIGEGGEAEYVIPASKMSEAMARYSAGARGSSVIPNGVNPQVNITTGPVTQMNGTNYVTQRDLMYATQTAAKEGATIALNSLRSNPSVRRSVGLAR